MELRDYLRVIRERKWIIIQAVVVVTLVATGVSLLQPRAYQGVAEILITDQDVGAAILGSTNGNTAGGTQGGLDTQVQLVQLPPLAEQVIDSLHLQMTPDDLLGEVSVAEVGQTNVITLTAMNADPVRAAAIANGLANAYVQWSTETVRESIRAAADQVQTQLSQATSEAVVLGQEAAASAKSGQSNAELNIAIANYTQLAQQLEELKVNEQLALGSGSVVSPAAVDSTPVSPKPVRDGSLGLVIGLVIGLGLAFLLEYLDNSIKSTDEAEKVYGTTVLGHIPAERAKKGDRRRLSIALHPGGAAAEAYRVLRNNLSFVNFQHDIRTLLITSSAPGEGKSTVAANLAMAFAQSGVKVVLVNADFHRPVTEEFFDVDNALGLSDVLLGRGVLNSALQADSDNLSVLNSGSMPPNPSELLGSQKMADLIKNLEAVFDWVIVDSPPLLVVADSSALVRWADAVLVVARLGVSTREAAKAAREALEKVGARTVGVVLWGLKNESKGVYGVYSAYGTYDLSPSHGNDPSRSEGGS